MIFSCIDSVNRDLIFQRNMLNAVIGLRTKLEPYRGKLLEARCRSGREEYTITYREDNTRKRLYSKNVSFSLVFGIVTLRFCDVIIGRLQNNIKWLERLVCNYRSVDIDDVIASLPSSYRIKSPGILGLYGITNALKWKEAAEEKKARNPNTYGMKHEHITKDGTIVRSKSEKEIYNMLLDKGFVFVYELPLALASGITIYPDFTIYLGRNRVLYIEHDGAFSKEHKRARTFDKMERYYLNGYAFGRDVIFTFDDPDETVDLKRIEAEIMTAIQAA